MLTLSERFRASAAQWPTRPGLSLQGNTWNYDQLNCAKDAVADHLISEGLTHARIGLLGDKTFGTFASILGILGSGSSYVPFNVAEPRDRLAKQIDSSRISAVLCTGSGLRKLLEALDVPRQHRREFQIGSERLVLADLRDHVSSPATGSGEAYGIFTSGSTGRPKEIFISQENVHAFLTAFSSVLPVEPSDRVLQVADLSFDFSVGEIFPTWAGGGCVVCPDKIERLALPAFCEHYDVSIWNSVPTLASALISIRAFGKGKALKLRRSVFCGEALPVSLAKTWREAVYGSDIFNLYGPTEATVFATWFKFTGDLPPDLFTVPIGEPLPGVKTIVDKAGELLLSGPQVAHQCIPQDQEPKGWYRTGDVVRQSPCHGLIFVSRLDDQIKVSGNRVDLIEVESQIRSFLPDIPVAVVPVIGAQALITSLAAFVESDFSESLLRIKCREALPRWMVPSRFIRVDSLPLTSSGKIDRRKLAALL